jgi:cell division protein FtsI/penicillin-binding protein 2
MTRRAFILFMLAHRHVLGATRSPACETAYLLLDASTRELLASRWDDSDRPLPVGSLIKPFTALAYAQGHAFTYPTFTCRGAADACWLPAGHGHIGIVDAIAGSCNAYFQRLAHQVAPDAFVATLASFGMHARAAAATVPAMVGLTKELMLAPSAVANAYAELAARANQPGVSRVAMGMMASARTGTGRAVGAALGPTDAFVKTGTAPCSHSPNAGGDGYTVVVYPADRPRVVLLAQAHGRTGAETAEAAGEILSSATRTR